MALENSHYAQTLGLDRAHVVRKAQLPHSAQNCVLDRAHMSCRAVVLTNIRSTRQRQHQGAENINSKHVWDPHATLYRPTLWKAPFNDGTVAGISHV